MRSLKLGSLLSLIALTACSVAPSAPDAVAEGSITAGSVCATLDYGHTVSTADYYRRFANDDEAGRYVRELVAEGKLASIAGPTATFREITRDERLKRLVREVFDGFRKVFPRETEGLTEPPPIAIIETDVVNAFALGPISVSSDAPGPERSPYAFFVHTALLNGAHTENGLRGLFAHELGHLLLRSFLPDVQRSIRAIYMVGTSEEGVIGAAQDDDPGIADHVETLLTAQKRVGGIPKLGLPLLLEGPIYQRLFFGMYTTEPCAAVRAKATALTAMQRSFVPHAGSGDFTPREPTAEERDTLERMTDEIGAGLRACFVDDGSGGSLLELSAVINQLPTEAASPGHPDHAKLLALTPRVELDVDAANPGANILERLLRAEKPLRTHVAALQDDPAVPIDRIRVFDYEEDADDAAVRVFAATGHDPLGNGEFLLGLMPDGEREACLRDVSVGTPIPFGRFIDPHPTMCWRYYHATQFAKALDRCEATALSAKRGTKGPGRPSVMDKTPMETVEPGYGRGQR